MSVRRLAEDSVQPAGFAFNPAYSSEADIWVGKYPQGREQSAVIPLLMLAQEQEGWVTRAAIEHVAQRLSMPLIRVLEVATFYTQFQLAPVGTRAHVQVCGTTPCMLMGAEKLKDVCRDRIHHDQFHRNAAGTLSWEEVECLGACVNAPMVIIGKDAYEDLTPERLAEIIEAFEAGRGDAITPGPQNGRTYSAPASGLTTLKEEIVASHWKDGNGSESKSAAAPTAPLGAAVSAPPAPTAAPAEKPSASPAPSDAPATTGDAKTRDAGAAGDATTAGKPDGYAPEGDTTLRKPGTQDAPKGAEQQTSTDAEVAPAAAADTRVGDGSDSGIAREGGAAEGGAVGFIGDAAPSGKPKRPASRPLAAAAGVPPSPDGDSASGSTHAGVAEPEGTRGSGPAGAATPVPGAPGTKAVKASDVPPPSLDAPERPRGIDRPDAPDDLQMISGIGPKIDGILHSLGIWTWAQIAAWTEEERAWVNGYLRFKGRIEREDWVRQADALARGGRDEYIRVFGKDPV